MTYHYPKPQDSNDAARVLRSIKPALFNKLSRTMHKEVVTGNRQDAGIYAFENQGLDRNLIISYGMIANRNHRKGKDSGGIRPISFILLSGRDNPFNREIAKTAADTWFKTKFVQNRLGSCPDLNDFIISKVDAAANKAKNQSSRAAGSKPSKSTTSSRTSARSTTRSTTPRQKSATYHTRSYGTKRSYNSSAAKFQSSSSEPGCLFALITVVCVFASMNTNDGLMPDTPMMKLISLAGIIASVIWFYICRQLGVGRRRYFIVLGPLFGLASHPLVSIVALLSMFPAVVRVLSHWMMSVFDMIANRN